MHAPFKWTHGLDLYMSIIEKNHTFYLLWIKNGNENNDLLVIKLFFCFFSSFFLYFSNTLKQTLAIFISLLTLYFLLRYFFPISFLGLFKVLQFILCLIVISNFYIIVISNFYIMVSLGPGLLVFSGVVHSQLVIE